MGKKIDNYDFIVNPRTKAVTGTLSCGVRIEITPVTNPKDWYKILKQIITNAIITNPNLFIDDIEKFAFAAIHPKGSDKSHAIGLLKIASGFIYGILETGESGVKIDRKEDNKKVTLRIIKQLFENDIIKQYGLKIDNPKNFTKTYINDGLNRLKNEKPFELTLLFSYLKRDEFWCIIFLLAAAKILNHDFFYAPEYSRYSNLINKAFPNL